MESGSQEQGQHGRRHEEADIRHHQQGDSYPRHAGITSSKREGRYQGVEEAYDGESQDVVAKEHPNEGGREGGREVEEEHDKDVISRREAHPTHDNHPKDQHDFPLLARVESELEGGYRGDIHVRQQPAVHCQENEGAHTDKAEDW